MDAIALSDGIHGVTPRTLVLNPTQPMHNPIQTNRLSLTPLTSQDSAFMFELVNTQGWLDFIGNRHVYSVADAQVYTKKILDTPTSMYWVVREVGTEVAMGIVTLIKRDYLDHHDIGFAFLPGYMGKNYAYEAAKAVLDEIRQQPEHACILATTVPANTRSIALLGKLGLRFDREIMPGKETLALFKIG